MRGKGVSSPDLYVYALKGDGTIILCCQVIFIFKELTNESQVLLY